MNYYIDITLLPDADVGLFFLWEKVYQQVHLALVSIKDEKQRTPIGVVFPEYDVKKNYLGRKLRLFSPDSKTFEQLNLQKWLSRLADYVHLTSIKNVPDNIEEYVCCYRVRLKTNQERLARRKAKRSNISFEEALTALDGFKEKRTDLPYIRLTSHETGQRFRLFVEQKPANVSSISKSFSCYGLSAEGVLPKF